MRYFLLDQSDGLRDGRAENLGTLQLQGNSWFTFISSVIYTNSARDKAKLTRIWSNVSHKVMTPKFSSLIGSTIEGLSAAATSEHDIPFSWDKLD